MNKLCLVLAGALALSASVVSADQVVFKNGDKLTGKITSLADGKLTLSTPVAGDVKIDMSQVSTFSTDAPIDMVLSDGTVVDQKIIAGGAGQVQIAGGLLGNQHVSVGDVESINPPQAVWTGDLKFGGLLIRGNTFSDSINFGLDLARTTKQDVISFNADYIYGRTKDRTTGAKTATADNWQMELKYDYNFTKKFYGFVDAIVAKDRLAFLDLRFNPAAGVGYRWFDKPDFKFATEGGIAWVYEKYTNATPTREDVSLKLAYHLVKNFNDKVSLFHDLSYYPSIENGKNYLVNTDLGLRSTWTKHLFSEFKFVLDYDSNPAIGALKTNLRYELNVGYSI
jgi:putative salt-induced outer membrane protein YdiY